MMRCLRIGEAETRRPLRHLRARALESCAYAEAHGWKGSGARGSKVFYVIHTLAKEEYR
jgi:hypothetical protein